MWGTRHPPGPSSKLLWSHKTCEGCAEISVGDACGIQPWGSMAELLWGHETCEECAEMNAGTHVALSLRDLRRSSYGAAKRVRGAPK
eukprot:1363182-Pyramimonas_sp.AAC.2